MHRRLFLLIAAAGLQVAAAGLLVNSLFADEDAASHVGTFVSAESEEGFVMADKGKEHNHTMAPGAKVVGPDGKAIKLADIKRGQMIRVTTKEGDATVATKVEVLKSKPEEMNAR